MNFNQIAQRLTASIRLSLPPIAICFTDKVPAGIQNWTGRVPAGCRFWQEAATEGFATSPSDHDMCAIGTFTHNLETTEAHDAEHRDALRVFADLGYVREQDIASIPVLDSRSSHVVYGPLATIPLAPDVVLLFGKADQMLILSEASQQVEGGLPPAMGRPACAIVPQAKNTGRAAVIACILESRQIKASLDRRESWPLINVRSPEEWVNGHIPGAQFLILTLELKFQALDTWPKDTRIVFYSNAGRRSLEVAPYFMAYGFTNVRNMAGGLEAWSGELQASNVPPLTVEVSAINDPSPGPYDVRIDGEDVTVEL